MSAINNELILDSLKAVKDGDQDIVSLNMISGLQIKDGHVAFALEVDPVRGPALEPLP